MDELYLYNTLLNIFFFFLFFSKVSKCIKRYLIGLITPIRNIIIINNEKYVHDQKRKKNTKKILE